MTRTNTLHKLNKPMPTHLPPPEEEDFCRAIHSLFVNGDLSHIARWLRKDQGRISKSYNPYCPEVASIEFEFLLRLWAMDCERDGLADAVLAKVIAEREKWLPDGVVAERASVLTGRVAHEYAEAVEFELDGADLDEQIREWDDVVRSATKKKASLIAQRAQRMVAGNGRLK